MSLQELAAGACISTGYLSRLFASTWGSGRSRPWSCCAWPRAATLLTRSNLGVAAVAYDCGFANPYHFSRRFRGVYGQPPGRYRRTTTRPAPSEPLAQAGLLALSERIWQTT